jgi:ABC-2 type transport system permease protein
MSRWSGTVDVLVISARHQMFIFLGSWRITLVLGILQPAVLLMITLSGSGRADPAHTGRQVVGVLLVSLWSFTVWSSAGILRQERVEGTLAPCLIGLRDARIVLIGKSAGTILMSGAMTVLTVVVVLACLGRPVQLHHPGWLAVGLVALLLSGLAAGLGLSSLFVLSRFGPEISAALMYPVFLLAGLLTPLSSLPVELRPLSWLISLRWAMQFLTGALNGTPSLAALGMVVLLTVAYGAAASVAFARFSAKVMASGTIDLV